MFGHTWSILETNTTGSQTYAQTIGYRSAGTSIFVFNVFAKNGTPTLYSTGVGSGTNGSFTVSVPSAPNVFFVAAIPQNDTISLGGTAGFTDSDKLAQGDMNSTEFTTAVFKEDITAGGVTTTGGATQSVVTGIVLNLS